MGGRKNSRGRNKETKEELKVIEGRKEKNERKEGRNEGNHKNERRKENKN